MSSVMQSKMAEPEVDTSKYDNMKLEIPPDDWQPPFVFLETSKGDIKLELYWKSAPNACKNFTALTKAGYYDGLTIHRILKGFIIQGGDHLGTGMGWKTIYGAKFDDEFDEELHHDRAGVLSMANSGPDTNGSQFFITLAADPGLDGVNTIFGRVVEGLDAVMRIGAVKTDFEDPLEKITIFKATIMNS